MDPLTLSALTSAGGQIAGSVVSGAMGMQNARESFKANQESIQQQEAFQERMSNTAIQRQVADAKAAGINPLFLFPGSSGAPSPSGGSASMPMAAPPDFSGVLSSALQVMSTGAALKKMDAETLRTVAETNEIHPNALSSRSLQLSQESLNEWQKNSKSIHEVLARILEKITNKVLPNPQSAVDGAARAIDKIPHFNFFKQ